MRLGAAIAAAAARTAALNLDPPALIRAEVRATLEAYAEDPALARIVLIEIVGATPGAERLHSRARNTAAKIIQLRLGAVRSTGRQRPPVASARGVAGRDGRQSASRSATSSPLANGRMGDARGPAQRVPRPRLIDPVDLA